MLKNRKNTEAFFNTSDKNVNDILHKNYSFYRNGCQMFPIITKYATVQTTAIYAETAGNPQHSVEMQTLGPTEPGAATGLNSGYWEVSELGLSCFPSDHKNHSWNFKKMLRFSQDPLQKAPAFESYLGDFQSQI